MVLKGKWDHVSSEANKYVFPPSLQMNWVSPAFMILDQLDLRSPRILAAK